MDPYQQNQGNPYDFILNPSEAPKAKKTRGFGGNHFLRNIAFIVGGAILSLIILTIAINALAPKKVSTADLTTLAQMQTEIMRVSAQGVSSGVRQSTKDLATTIQFTMATQQKQTLDVLAKNKVKVSSKQLALTQDATTDQKFTTAKSTSTFDKTFTEVIQTELTDYANTLKRLSSIAVDQAERNRMSDYYQQTQLLISQIPYTQGNIDSTGTSGTP